MKLKIVFVLILAFTPTFGFTQSDQLEHPQQILYRDNDQLYLVDVETGESIQLPDVETKRFDGWLWSPDGQYLLAQLKQDVEEGIFYTIRIYDVDNLGWLENVSIDIEGFGYPAWSPDSQRFTYANNHEGIGELWVFSLITNETQLIYQTPEPDNGIADLGVAETYWSPDGSHLLFEDYDWIMGGSINNLNLIDPNGGEAIYLYGQYYASFSPVWSPDGNWFLLTLQRSYYSGGTSEDGEYGDVYLYSALNGSYDQLTNTPELGEYNLRWSDDGSQIQFNVYDDETRLVNTVSMELQDVLDNPEEIQSIVETATQNSNPMLSFREVVSPNGILVAYLIDASDGRFSLYVANVDGSDSRFIVDIDDEYALYGWRP